MNEDLELSACSPIPINPEGSNPMVELPYGLQNEHIMLAMNDFLGFLGFVNQQLNTRRIPRLESILMPANFSSIVDEFINNEYPQILANPCY